MLGFSSLPSTLFTKLLHFATKYLRKTVHSVVEIYSFLLGPEEMIAILVKICFSLNIIVRFASSLFLLFVVCCSCCWCCCCYNLRNGTEGTYFYPIVGEYSHKHEQKQTIQLSIINHQSSIINCRQEQQRTTMTITNKNNSERIFSQTRTKTNHPIINIFIINHQSSIINHCYIQQQQQQQSQSQTKTIAIIIIIIINIFIFTNSSSSSSNNHNHNH